MTSMTVRISAFAFCTIESISLIRTVPIVSFSRIEANPKRSVTARSPTILFLYGPLCARSPLGSTSAPDRPCVHPVTFHFSTRSGILNIPDGPQPSSLKLFFRHESIAPQRTFQSFQKQQPGDHLTTPTAMFFLTRLRNRRRNRTGLSRYRFTLFRQRLHPHPQSQATAPATQHPYSILI